MDSIIDELAKSVLQTANGQSFTEIMRNLNNINNKDEDTSYPLDLKDILEQIKDTPVYKILTTNVSNQTPSPSKKHINKCENCPAMQRVGKLQSTLPQTCGESTDDMPRINIPVDIREMEKSVIVYADLPGVNGKSISIDVDGQNLIIQANKVDYPIGTDEFPLKERSMGIYYRSVKMPDSVDFTSVQGARYVDGVLTLRIPKRDTEPLFKRRIPVVCNN